MMHTNFIRTWALVVLLLLAGCSGAPVRSTATVAEVNEKAVVILSVSHDMGAGNGANAIFYLDQGRYPGRVVMKSVQDTLSVPTPSDFSNRRGHLYVLELDPGLHQIDGWQVASAGVRITSKEAIVPLVFEVSKGEVLYLGNLHASLMLGHGLLFGGKMAIGAVPVVMDRSSEDIALAEARIPSLKGKVRVALLSRGPWINGKETVKKLDPIAVPFIPKR